MAFPPCPWKVPTATSFPSDCVRAEPGGNSAAGAERLIEASVGRVAGEREDLTGGVGERASADDHAAAREQDECLSANVRKSWEPGDNTSTRAEVLVERAVALITRDREATVVPELVVEGPSGHEFAAGLYGDRRSADDTTVVASATTADTSVSLRQGERCRRWRTKRMSHSLLVDVEIVGGRAQETLKASGDP
jgi:hypothetical protein